MFWQRHRLATTDVWGAIGPLYSMSRWMGLYPWKLSTDGVPPTRPLLTPLMMTIFHAISGPAICYAVVFNSPELWVKLPYLYQIVHRAQTASTYICLGVALTYALVKGRQVTPIYGELAAVDSSLSSLGMVFKYDLFYSLVGIPVRLLLMGIYLVIFFLTHPYRFTFSFSARVIFFVHTLFIHFFRLHFTTIVSLLKAHFLFISDRLQSTGDSCPYLGRTWKLECLVVAHDGLCTAADRANDLFSLQNLVWVNTVFVFLTGNCYLIADGLASGNIVFDNLYLFDVIVLSVYWGAELWETVYEAKTAKDESRRFTKILFDLLLKDRTGELSTNKILSLHVDMSKEVEFTACGFFPLDYTLFHSMIAATATYLIVLAQYSEI
ncbi:hypothetical protein AAG570_013668 [Ranatra chinensis]|uniref:Gustatory receptor n=1 Tax=Ranatra chinensis TaxID=642074 RepID=A0ABD0YD28_9HEMI